MILKRETKLFRRDFLPEEERFTKIIDDLSKENVEIKIETSKSKWASDKSKLGPLDRKTVDLLKKDIKEGYIYTDGPNGGDTHYLKDFSNNESHLMSKIINTNDRLNYRVYAPEIVMQKDKNGNYIGIIATVKIVLESCLGHGRNGARNYSDTE